MRRRLAILGVVLAGWSGWGLAPLPASGDGRPSGSAGASAVPPSLSEPAKGTPGMRGAEGLSAMLREATTAHAQLRDYTCTFTRQERRHGVLGPEEVARMQVRVQPLGVRVRFTHPSAIKGMELAYSAQTRPGKIRLRPAGPAGLHGFRLLEADDPTFLTNHRYPLPEWTIAALLQRLTATVERERNLRNPIEVFTADDRYAQQEVTRYELLLRRPHAFRTAARIVLLVDKKSKLPLRYEAYASIPTADPTASGVSPARSDVLEMYSYTDLQFNTGLSEKVFAE
jgi:hypothetical protein